MPPNLTHSLQPLDVAVFQPLKHYQAKALDIIVRDGCTKITKLEFLLYIQEIRIQAMKEFTFKSAFRKTNIWPFNPQVVLQQIASRIPEHTPPPPPPFEPSSSLFSTPITLRHTHKISDTITNYLAEHPDPDPDFARTVANTVRGLVINTAELVQTKRDLGRTQLAEREKKNVASPARTFICNQEGYYQLQKGEHVLRSVKKMQTG
jgi:hypothetical protein